MTRRKALQTTIAAAAAVRRGCGLILTGLSSECDENFRQRERPALADLYDHARVRYFAKCPGTTPQNDSTLHAAMPAEAVAILESVALLARQGLAAELRGGDDRQPLSFVDVYRIPGATVAHVIFYGDGEPRGFRLRVAGWIGKGIPELFSPYISAPVALKPDADGWMELPGTFRRYCAVRFA